LLLELLEKIRFEQVAADQIEGGLTQGQHRKVSGTPSICSCRPDANRVQTARGCTAFTAWYGIHTRPPRNSALIRSD
jgi:hypothetical protein